MASANHRGKIKPKKEGGGGTYVYNMGGVFEPPPESESVVKKVINPRIWGNLIRSKTYRERTITEVKKEIITTTAPQNEELIAVKSRKSVSSIAEKSRNSASEMESTAVKSRKSVSSIVDRTRSSVSEMELAAARLRSAVELLRVKVLVSDMPAFMQLQAFRCARTTFDCLETFSSKHIAFNIKKEFDKVYGPAWHCIVGSSFGSFVTHSTGGFLYFSMENLYILLFKTKVQKALHS